MGNIKGPIAEKPLALTKRKLRGLILLSSFPLFGMVAAFGIAPDTSLEDLPVQQVVLSLSLPEIHPSPDPDMIVLAAGTHPAWRYHRIPAFAA